MIQAAGTKATKPFFHAYVRAPEGEELTRDQWQTFADRLEKQLGFDDQPRAMAFHHGANGEIDMHIAWSRIALASLTAIDPGLYKNKMKKLCRDFEREFGLTPVANERAEDVKTKSANRPEFEQSRRLGTDLKAIRNTIHDCWQSADSGQAFAAALAEHGLILPRAIRDHSSSSTATAATMRYRNASPAPRRRRRGSAWPTSTARRCRALTMRRLCSASAPRRNHDRLKGHRP